MNILALDLATKTGWAHSDGRSGVADFTAPKPIGNRWRSAWNWLWCEMHSNPPAFVVYEKAHQRGYHATHSAHALITITEFIIASRNPPPQLIGYHTGTIKKHATGTGRASKVDMIEAARVKWPNLEIIDDNHADVLWLLDLAQTELEPNQ